MKREKKRWAGIDRGKRTYEAKVIDAGGGATGFNGKTDAEGIGRMIHRLRTNDAVGIEAGVLSVQYSPHPDRKGWL